MLVASSAAVAVAKCARCERYKGPLPDLPAGSSLRPKQTLHVGGHKHNLRLPVGSRAADLSPESFVSYLEALIAQGNSLDESVSLRGYLTPNGMADVDETEASPRSAGAATIATNALSSAATPSPSASRKSSAGDASQFL